MMASMEPAEPIFRMTCYDCGLPAVTYDESNNSFCASHATALIRATRVLPDEDDFDWPASPN